MCDPAAHGETEPFAQVYTFASTTVCRAQVTLLKIYAITREEWERSLSPVTSIQARIQAATSAARRRS